MTDENPRPKPSPRDWALLAINIVFVVMGLVILPSSPDVGIVTLAMFGSCLAVAAWQIARKLRDRKFSATTVAVTGAVPIREGKSLGVLVGVWLAILGLLLVVFGETYPVVFRWLGGGVAIAGLGVLAAIAAGRYANGFLQFDPDALTIGQTLWVTRIPWDNIAAVTEGEMQGNAMLMIALHDPSAISLSPPEGANKATKAIATNQAFYGAEIAILTAHYGVSLPMLAAAIQRYASVPQARAELANPPDAEEPRLIA